MEKIIKDFFEYLKTRDEGVLLTTTKVSEDDNLAVIVINILNWLKLEKKRSIWKAEGKAATSKPMKIEKDITWYQDLINIVKNEPEFSKVFAISENGLGFSKNIPQGKRDEIQTQVYERHNPVKFISRR